jgi:hypothetical protein
MNKACIFQGQSPKFRGDYDRSTPCFPNSLPQESMKMGLAEHVIGIKDIDQIIIIIIIIINLIFLFSISRTG